MAQRRRYQRDGRAVVDRMACMGMPEPMHGGGRVDAGAPGRSLDDEIHRPLGQRVTWVAYRLEYGRIGRRLATALQQPRGDWQGDQDLTGLAALANDLQLRLTAVALDDLSPAEADELGDCLLYTSPSPRD